jgi:hypothetical protein
LVRPAAAPDPIEAAQAFVGAYCAAGTQEPSQMCTVVAASAREGTRRKETIMSDYDPNRMDPNRPAIDETRYAGDSGFNWSWIIGGIAAIVVLIVGRSGRCRRGLPIRTSNVS